MSETCGRCGHPKAEHVRVDGTDGDGKTSALFVCPTALFTPDPLTGLMDEDGAA